MDHRRDQRGATAVEYGLLVALIAALLIFTEGTWDVMGVVFDAIMGDIADPD